MIKWCIDKIVFTRMSPVPVQRKPLNLGKSHLKSDAALPEVRLLDCGTKVSVSVLSCMILLSVSQFNREAFGE